MRHEDGERAELRTVVRRFGVERLAPAIAAAEHDHDGHLPHAEIRRLLGEAARLGLPGLLIGERYGGAGGGHRDNVAVMEELGAIDAGFAAGLGLTMTVPALIAAAGTEAQQASWLPGLASGDRIVAGAMNEPSVAGSELFDPEPAADRGLTTRARRDDAGGYVLTGAKAPWVTNAGLATDYIVFARTDPDVPGPRGTGAFWVPADTPGLSVGPRSDLLGLRGGCHAELRLDRVRVGAGALIGPPGGALPLLMESTPGMAVGLAAVFVGLARAARDAALAHTAERTSWGRPIREHQAVALRLADMDTRLRSTRLLVQAAAELLDDGSPAGEAAARVPQAKAAAVDAAIANASDAVRLHGATGVTTGAGPEKLLRDAWTGYACDFTGDLLRLATAAALPPG